MPADLRANIQWIFLHGQVPTLYKFTEDKKKIDFSRVDIFGLLPALRGVILGDIHDSLEGQLSDRDKTAFIGYCGSPGIIDASEVAHSKSVLYFNGSSLCRLPFNVGRTYIRYDSPDKVDVAELVQSFRGSKKSPVFIIEATESTTQLSTRLRPLSEVGIVKMHYKRAERTDSREPLNIRSELSTTDRIGAVLENLTTDQSLRDVAFEILTNDEDVEAKIDQLKVSMLNG